MTINRDALGRILPGNTLNPGGRPKMPVSFDKLLAERLASDPSFAQDFMDRVHELIKRPDEHMIEYVWERVDGKVPSELALSGIMIHVGDDYAREGIESIRKELTEKQERYLLTGPEHNTT